MDAGQTILQAKYARIIKGIADRLHIPVEEAMDGFYHSQIFRLMDQGIADMHCRSDIYLVDEYCSETLNSFHYICPVRGTHEEKTHNRP